MPNPRRQITSFRTPTAGLVSSVSERDLPENALARCSNFNVDETVGRLTVRDAWGVYGSARAIGGIQKPIRSLVGAFEFPVLEPAGAQRPPVVLLATKESLSGGENPEAIYGLVAYMRPHYSSGAWVDSWGFLGDLHDFGTIEPESVTVSHVARDGVIRFFISYAETASQSPTEILLPARFLQFFRLPDEWFGAPPPGGDDFYIEKARMWPPGTEGWTDGGEGGRVASDLTITTTVVPDPVVGNINGGSRLYRYAYQYDGFQIGALSDPVSVVFPEGEPSALRLDLKATPSEVSRRVTGVHVFTLIAEDAPWGPGRYVEVALVDARSGVYSNKWHRIIDSDTGDNLRYFISVSPDMYGFEGNLERSGYIQESSVGNAWNDFAYVVMGQEASPAGASPGVDPTWGRWCEPVRQLIPARKRLSGQDHDVAWIGTGVKGDDRTRRTDAYFGYGRNDVKPVTEAEPGNSILFGGVYTKGEDNISTYPEIKWKSGYNDGTVLPAIAAIAAALESARATEDGGFFGYGVVDPETPDFLVLFSYGESTGLPRGNTPVIAKPGARIRMIEWMMPEVGLGQFFKITLDSEIPTYAHGKPMFPHQWLFCTTSIIEDFYSQPNTSFITTEEPSFLGDVGGDPSGALKVKYQHQEFSMNDDGDSSNNQEQMATDGRTLLFTWDDASPAWPSSVTGGHVDTGRDWSSGHEIHIYDDLSNETVQQGSAFNRYYSDIAQHSGEVNWADGSVSAIVGDRVFVGDVAIPVPNVRFDAAEDYERFRYNILYSGFTGYGTSSPDSILPQNLVIVGGGVSKVRGLSEMSGRLVVLTDEGVFLVFVAAGNSAGANVERKWIGFGCVSAKSVVETKMGLAWLSQRGVCLMAPGGPQIISGAIASPAFLEAIATSGSTAAMAFEPANDRLSLALGGEFYVRSSGGGWVQYETGSAFNPVSLVGSLDGGFYAVGDIEGVTDSFLMRTDSSLSKDFYHYGQEGIDPLLWSAHDVKATARFPSLQPAGGDRMAKIMAATYEFTGTAGLSAYVDSENISFGKDDQTSKTFKRVRVPVGYRGRTVWVDVRAIGPDSAVDRVAIEFAQKGRVRS